MADPPAAAPSEVTALAEERKPTLATRVVRGALWSVATSIGGRAVGLVATLTLTRFLAPDVYGEVNTAFIVVATASVLAAPGMGQYLVAQREADERAAFHATFFHVVLGAVAMLAVWLAADWLGPLLKVPNLGLYVPALAAATFVERISYMPGRVLAREMRFKVIGLRMLLGELVYAGVGIYLAWRGFGGYAVLWAIVARTALTAVLLIASVEWRKWLSPSRLDLELTKRLFRFGLPLSLSNDLHWVARRGDNLLIVALFGAGPVGQYNLAYNLADIPATHVGEQIGDVMLPSFARISDHAARERAMVRAAGLLALLVFPLAIGLGAIAHDLVRAIFDARWAPVAPMLVVLSALSILRPIGWLVGNYLQALARTRTVLALEGVRAASVAGFVLGLGQLGVLWACAGIGCAFGVATFAGLWSLHKADQLPLTALLRPLVRPLLACIPMAIAVLGVRHALDLSAWLAVLLQLVAGAVAYVGGALLIASDQARDMLGLLRRAFHRPSP
ncbi:MAG TPA: oligosaccharide flippase family protein [Polyangiaceae bacterium]|jgi:PST family polysaccharide transporter|nr:oligosaccharide flippase family protein [Polyangiaceae bacterium]